MKICSAPQHQATSRVLRMVGATALAVACTVAPSQFARRQGHTTTRARRTSGAGGTRGVPRGARHRHPELRLPAVPEPEHPSGDVSRRLRIRLAPLHTGGHPVPRQRRASHRPLLQPQPIRTHEETRMNRSRSRTTASWETWARALATPLLLSFIAATVALAPPAWAEPFFFSTGNP